MVIFELDDPWPTSAVRFSSGDISALTVATCSAILPNSVCMPVAKTRPRASPDTSEVPAKLGPLTVVGLGGMQMPAWLAEGCDDRLIARAAGDRGLTVSPMTGYFLGPPDRAGLYLGYAGVPDQEVEPALATLRDILGASTQERPSR